MNFSRVIAITMGDPGGIGPEIALKAVSRAKWPASARFVLIGCREVWIETARRLKLRCPECLESASGNTSISILDPVPSSTVIPAKAGIHPPRRTTYVGMTRKNWRPGKTGASEGLASLLWIRSAVAGCQEGRFNGIVTGPICKSSIQSAGFDFPGHTEYLAFLAKRKKMKHSTPSHGTILRNSAEVPNVNASGRRRVAMMLIGEPLRVVLVTRHLPFASVTGAITKEKIIEAVEMAHLGMKWLGSSNKTIGVCALNPHAGDDGLLGKEEKSIISPAINILRQKGLKIEGPIPADVIFHQAMQNKFGVVVAMYHDQGLGPLKMHAFETGVNITLGLPFVRTSPDHGTAFDIAGKGIANPASMVEAIRLAIRLASRPNPW